MIYQYKLEFTDKTKAVEWLQKSIFTDLTHIDLKSIETGKVIVKFENESKH